MWTASGRCTLVVRSLEELAKRLPAHQFAPSGETHAHEALEVLGGTTITWFSKADAVAARVARLVAMSACNQPLQSQRVGQHVLQNCKTYRNRVSLYSWLEFRP